MYTELLTFMLRKSSEEVEAKDIVNSTDWHATTEMVSANQDLTFSGSIPIFGVPSGSRQQSGR